MSRISVAAALAAIVTTTAAGLGHAEPWAGALRVAPGQTVQQAIQMARIEALRAKAPRAVNPAKGTIPPAITAGAVPGGTITVGTAQSLPTLQFTYQAKDFGLNYVQLTFTSPNGANSLNYYYYPRSYVKGGTITFTPDINAPYYAQPGQWQLTGAIIVDTQYNYTQYSQSQLAALFPQPYLTVVNNGPVDITPPVVTSGQILTPTVSESSPEPRFEATLTGTDDVSGLFTAYVIITPPGSPFGQIILVPTPFPSLSGTVTSYAPVFPGQPTGTWSISTYELCDVAGNCFTDSNPADIQTLFGTNTFTVTN